MRENCDREGAGSHPLPDDRGSDRSARKKIRAGSGGAGRGQWGETARGVPRAWVGRLGKGSRERGIEKSMAANWGERRVPVRRSSARPPPCLRQASSLPAPPPSVISAAISMEQSPCQRSPLFRAQAATPKHSLPFASSARCGSALRLSGAWQVLPLIPSKTCKSGYRKSSSLPRRGMRYSLPVPRTDLVQCQQLASVALRPVLPGFRYATHPPARLLGLSRGTLVSRNVFWPESSDSENRQTRT